MAKPKPVPSSQDSDDIPSSQDSILSDTASQIVPDNDDAPHQRKAIRREDRAQRRRQRRDEDEDGEWSPSQETEEQSSSPEPSEDEGTLRPASTRFDGSDEGSSFESESSEDESSSDDEAKAAVKGQMSSDPPDHEDTMPEAVTEDWLRILYYIRRDLDRHSPADAFETFDGLDNRPKLAGLDDDDGQIAWNIIMHVYEERCNGSDDEEEAPDDLRGHARHHWALYVSERK